MDYIKKFFGLAASDEAKNAPNKTEKPRLEPRSQKNPSQSHQFQSPVLRELAPNEKRAQCIQGLDWFTKCQFKDTDGDVADQFLEEPHTHNNDDEKGPVSKHPRLDNLQTSKIEIKPTHVVLVGLTKGNVTVEPIE